MAHELVHICSRSVHTHMHGHALHIPGIHFHHNMCTHCTSPLPSNPISHYKFALSFQFSPFFYFRITPAAPFSILHCSSPVCDVYKAHKPSAGTQSIVIGMRVVILYRLTLILHAHSCMCTKTACITSCLSFSMVFG